MSNGLTTEIYVKYISIDFGLDEFEAQTKLIIHRLFYLKWQQRSGTPHKQHTKVWASFGKGVGRVLWLVKWSATRLLVDYNGISQKIQLPVRRKEYERKWAWDAGNRTFDHYWTYFDVSSRCLTWSRTNVVWHLFTIEKAGHIPVIQGSYENNHH